MGWPKKKQAQPLEIVWSVTIQESMSKGRSSYLKVTGRTEAEVFANFKRTVNHLHEEKLAQSKPGAAT